MEEMEDITEFKIPEEALEKLKDPGILRRQLKEGKTFQDIIGYSVDVMEKFYQSACSLFERQEYKKAGDAFVFLTTMNPYVHNYWLGLGMSEQMNGSFQSALMAYAMAILTDVENPTAHYHSANCYKMLEDRENAEQSLEMALRCSIDKPEFTHFKERCTSLLEMWRGKK